METPSDRGLLRIQAISGSLFLAFLVVHLANTFVGVGGAEPYNAFQRSSRVVYQFPPIEVIFVVLPLLVHVVAAGFRISRHGLRRPRQSWRSRLHRYTGYFLLSVVFLHMMAVRGPSFLFGVYPEFEGVSFSLWWQPWIFYPYYSVFSCAALYHGMNGAGLALSLLGVSVPRFLREGPVFWFPIWAGTTLVVAALLTLGGVFGEIADPTDNAYARLYLDYLNSLTDR